VIHHPTLGPVQPGSIVAEFVCSPECPVCHGEGTVCEAHPDVAWGEGDGCCGAAGMPCPNIAKANAYLGPVDWNAQSLTPPGSHPGSPGAVVNDKPALDVDPDAAAALHALDPVVWLRRYGLRVGPLHVTWRDLWASTWCFEIAWYR
jgi:hypothetical protein